MDLRYELKYWDLARLPWCARFYIPNYNGIVEQLKGSGDPIRIEFQNGGDDYHDPFRPTQAVIEVQVDKNWRFTDLFAPNIMHCWVEIFQGEDENGKLFFQGWVDPSQYGEPYDVPPYYLTITVVDGLKYLQDIKFAVEQNPDATYTYYEDRALECEILWDIFEKIGVTEYQEYINLYEVAMTRSPAYSSIHQLLLERDRFFDLSCSEVLIEILLKYGAVIRQRNGIFQIFRPIELLKPVMHGRRWYSKIDFDSVSFNTAQYIRRRNVSESSPLVQIPGGNQMMVLPARRIEVIQEYGSRESWVNNYRLHKDSFDPETRMFKDWQRFSEKPFNHPTAYPIPLSDIVAREEEGVVLRYASAISQRFGRYTFEVDKNNKEEMFKVEFEYGFYNLGAEPRKNPFASFFLRQVPTGIPVFVNKHYLKYENIEDSRLEWSYIPWTENYMSIVNTQTQDEEIGYGWTGWRTASFYFYGMPLSDYLEIGVGNAYTNTVSVAFKNVRFSVTSAELIKKTEKRSFWERLTAYSIPFLLPHTILLPLRLFALRHTMKQKYFLKDTWSAVDHVVENEYNPKVKSEHGEELVFDFTLGDVVKISDPKNKGDTDIVNNLEQFAGSLAIIAVPSLLKQLQNFVNLWYSFWYQHGVVVSTDTPSPGVIRLIFTSTDVDVDFATAAAISITDGNLTGSASTIIPMIAGTRQIVRIQITGSSGYCDITINDKTRRMQYVPNTIRATITHFMRLFGNDFHPVIASISLAGDELILTGDEEGNVFTYHVTAGNGLNTQAFLTQPASPIGRRTDAIVIGGTYGEAIISCNGESKLITITNTPPSLAEVIFGDWLPLPIVTPSSKWRYDGAAYDSYPQKRLLEIIGDEIASQYARSKYLVQMPIWEVVKNQESVLNINGSIIDPINEDDGTARVYAINRGSFSTRHRKWELDLIELLPYTGPDDPVEYDPPEYDVDIELDSDEVGPEDSDYVPPESESIVPPVPEILVALNNFVGIIPIGRYGTTFNFTFEYTCLSTITTPINYYFSSDQAGNNIIGTVKTASVNFQAGIREVTIQNVLYPSAGDRYLQVQLQEKATETLTSAVFTSVEIVINSITPIQSPQMMLSSITPKVTFSTTAVGGTFGTTIYWAIRDSDGNILRQGSEGMNFTGTQLKEFWAVTTPGGGPYLGCTLGIGFTITANQVISNQFDIAAM